MSLHHLRWLLAYERASLPSCCAILYKLQVYLFPTIQYCACLSSALDLVFLVSTRLLNRAQINSLGFRSGLWAGCDQKASVIHLLIYCIRFLCIWHFASSCTNAKSSGNRSRIFLRADLLKDPYILT